MTVDTIVVTGAFGQIGKRCAQILLDRGRTVIAVDLRNDKTVAVEQELSAKAPAGALVPAYVNLTDGEAVRELIATHQPGAIVHLAALLSPAGQRLDSRLFTVPAQGDSVDVTFAVTRPQLWDLDHPRLYRVDVEVIDASKRVALPANGEGDA